MRRLLALLSVATMLGLVLAAVAGPSPASAAPSVCVTISAKDQYGGLSTSNAIVLDGSPISTPATKCFSPNTTHTLSARDIGSGTWAFQYWERRPSGGSWSKTTSRSISFTASRSWDGGEFSVRYKRTLVG